MKFTDRQEKWHYYFTYVDGKLFWNSTAFHRVVGKEAGSFNGNYYTVRVEGTQHFLHKIVYEMHCGEVDTGVDHRDGDKTNNRIENLRPATKSQNEANTARRSTNTSGYKGVYWLKNAGKWRAKIDFNKKQIHIGLFDSKHEAAIAYNRKAIELFGEYASLNRLGMPYENP